MLRTIFTVSLFFIASIASAYDFGDFTADTPSGWTMSDYPGIKYKVVLAPPENGFTPNIVSNSQPAIMSFDETVEAEINMLGAMIPGIEIHERKEITLPSGLKAVMVLTSSVQSGHHVRQRMYLVDGKKNLFVIACTVAKEHGSKYDKECFNFANTFTLK
jgi:hypothetical protein